MDVGDIEQPLPQEQLTQDARPANCERVHARLSCNWLERFFFRLGQMVGRNPGITLAVSMLVCAAAGSGILFWREELSDVELFMAKDSEVRGDAKWVEKYFRDEIRYESVIVVADNILDPGTLSAISQLDDAVRSINVDGYTWDRVCSRYLSWFLTDNSTFDEDTIVKEIEMTVPTGSFHNDCIFQSILKLWPGMKPEDMEKFNKDDILKNITKNINAGYNLNVLQDIGPLLSGMEWNENGTLVTGAKATLMNWMLSKTHSKSPDWELKFIEQTLHSNRTLPNGMRVYALTERSYKDLLQMVLETNMTVLFAGFSLIICYVIFMLGRCNMIGQRVYLSLFGVSVVGQSIFASYGLCFYLNFFYGPIHPILPFLLLGIGVDDMFVIVQALDNLSVAEKRLDVPEKVGCALMRAGASITVTSVTDIAAFAIGTTTVMPSLRSFCVFAAFGIFFLYIFELTFFVSCVCIDEFRMKAKRDGCIFRKHPNWTPNSCSQRNIQKLIFEKYVGPFVLSLPVKIIIVTITLVILAFNIWGVFQVEQKFDPIWYLNPDSYPMHYTNALKQYFPKYGKRAGIYMGEIDYFAEKDKLNELITQVEDNPYINGETIDFWWKSYQKWLDRLGYVPENYDEFKGYLVEFLFMTKEGQPYIKDIKFSSFPLGDYNITASQIIIQHIHMNTTAEQVKAMQSIRDLIHSINFTTGPSRIVAYSPEYVSWTANQVIGEELLRNLGLTILTVALVTILLIQNFQSAIWVICCVCFTLVNLVGSMYLFGLTIEISTSIVILLCVGLAVDYSAHIGHTFTRLAGTRNERALATLVQVGPAVFNGGMSTFLAFVLLGRSDSYIFTTFFKLFFSVVIYGLFHGLLFLPVILSWLGPNAPDNVESEIYSVPTGNCNGFVQPDAENKDDMELPSVAPISHVGGDVVHEIHPIISLGKKDRHKKIIIGERSKPASRKGSKSNSKRGWIV
ncbi:patched domain-containing protein 3-like [Ischnura elegans]|uniref:patched domain-containing protein 3-like n=1 Tax=Ischnura elegans TaxID=197161 RepID=UPI001ED8AEF5|nr:patched domain-containing protein 3-like [Ischnura elegans]